MFMAYRGRGRQSAFNSCGSRGRGRRDSIRFRGLGVYPGTSAHARRQASKWYSLTTESAVADGKFPICVSTIVRVLNDLESENMIDVLSYALAVLDTKVGPHVLVGEMHLSTSYSLPDEELQRLLPRGVTVVQSRTAGNPGDKYKALVEGWNRGELDVVDGSWAVFPPEAVSAHSEAPFFGIQSVEQAVLRNEGQRIQVVIKLDALKPDSRIVSLYTRPGLVTWVAKQINDNTGAIGDAGVDAVDLSPTGFAQLLGKHLCDSTVTIPALKYEQSMSIVDMLGLLAVYKLKLGQQLEFTRLGFCIQEDARVKRITCNLHRHANELFSVPAAEWVASGSKNLVIISVLHGVE